MRRRINRANIVSLTISGLLLSVAYAQTDSRDVLDGFDMTPGEIEKLQSGEILTYSDEAYEFTKRELSADAMMLVDADLDAIIKALQDDPTLLPRDAVTASAEIHSEEDFAGIGYTAKDLKEADDLFAAKPGKDFNFSGDEYAMLQQLLGPHRNGSDDEKLKAASDAMRSILIARFNQYQAQGLAGVPSYQRSRKKVVDVGAELQLTTDAIRPFKSDFPEFVKVMLTYPDGADCCRHVHRWVRTKIRKRPVFALSHTMIRVTDEFALVTERVYFVSSQLNSVQITTFWLPAEQGGYLGLATSASADILDSAMGRMLRPVGRNKAKDIVTGVMEETKADLDVLTKEVE